MQDLIIWSVGLDRKDGDPLIRYDQLTIVKPEVNPANDKEITMSSQESISSSNPTSNDDQTFSEHDLESISSSESNSKINLEDVQGAWVKLERESDHAYLPCMSTSNEKQIKPQITTQNTQTQHDQTSHDTKEETKNKISKSIRSIYSRLIS